MSRKTKIALAAAALTLAAAGAGGAIMLSGARSSASVKVDLRQDAPTVLVSLASPVVRAERRFTGVIAARVQSNLGFRVPGKIVERLVNIGQAVKAGQPLLRIDETDLRWALTAKRNAAVAARAVLTQATADEMRYAVLVKNGFAASPQRYEQAKAALDTATAQAAATEAEAKVAENELGYAVLVADADGVVVDTSGEPGQVVAAGQVVTRLAQAGPREAVVALPETIRPAIGSAAQATLYGSSGRSVPARLRQLSDSADPQTRTYEARYVLDGDAAAAPLGGTVTIGIAATGPAADMEVPLGAVLDDGSRTGVWRLDETGSLVTFQPVRLVRVTSETAIVSGLEAGLRIVSLGAHLLREGQPVRPSTTVEAVAR
ncbi:efflux RND transporter periplasmic adaptor subunit [Bosea sp. 124]|uniref:efflux RND transporter periplasmic adaptor subunit n=1 Tax=Bosea sp. 124 TaxID=2135642 RepID=UPI000D4B164C|nr:efflux RND transporter periplasmic adaptor subunit [Bosea sp. 124]PTM39488.1 RND family efflux transporter MFP subunit [Bosea sp. 124]